MTIRDFFCVADGFTALMTQHMQAENKRTISGIAALFEELVEKIMVQERATAFLKPKENSVSATIKFTKEEIAQMDENFQKEIKSTGKIARVIKTVKNSRITYEIRYYRNGYALSVSSSDLIEAKQKFIQETKLGNIKIGA